MRNEWKEKRWNEKLPSFTIENKQNIAFRGECRFSLNKQYQTYLSLF